ncbi:MAG: vitamin B12 dependent-methionine synthase activation domain-containing protein [Candidatus Omnitrophota bacterium]
MIITDIEIDWDWTEKSLLKKERILPHADSAILKSAREALDRAKELAAPKAAFTKKTVRAVGRGGIDLAGGIAFKGKSLSKYIKGSRAVYLFLVTIGPAVENEASALMGRGESLQGYLLDRAGSFAVESMADALGSRILKEDGPGDKSVSMPFSPGYCDWPVDEQVKLDKILGFSKIGVRLTESCMMVPRKSISGLIGIGPVKLYSKTRPKCGICHMKNCGFRIE